MYCSEGVNFKDHLYVPEVSERTGEPQHEREDHNHLLKRIAGSLRQGWKMYRTTGPLVPENFWGCQKIF